MSEDSEIRIEGKSGHTIHIESGGEVLGEGSEGVISRRIVTVEGRDNNRQLQLVYKELLHPHMTGELLKRYQLVKSAGLHVPNTYRIVGGGILMSDLTNSGKNLVISPPDIADNHYFRQRLTEDPNLVRLYMDLDIQSAYDAYQEELEYAIKNEIVLDHDDVWFLVKAPQKPPYFLVGDFLHVYKSEYNSPEKLRYINTTSFEACRNILKYGQEWVRSRFPH